jgi:CRP-like cAMP-binding protein
MSIVTTLIKCLEARDTLTESEKALLNDVVLEPVSVPAKTETTWPGDRPGRCTLLLSGLMARTKVSIDGQKRITAIHVPGDFVDLHSFLLHEMDHAIETLTPCEVVYVPHPTIARITEAQPHLTRLFWLSTVIDGAIHREWLITASKPSRQQLAHLLCELYVRLKAVDLAADGKFRLPLTQETVANVLGITPVHVNRTIQSMRVDVIEWRGADIKILDWDRLAEEAEFDPAYLCLKQEPR